MKTNAAITSIDCFHGRVQDIKEKQHALILSVMDDGKDYTGQQLSHLTGYPPNIISARLFELREEEKKVTRSKNRVRCPFSRVSVFTHRKAAIQPGLFDVENTGHALPLVVNSSIESQLPIAVDQGECA